MELAIYIFAGVCVVGSLIALIKAGLFKRKKKAKKQEEPAKAKPDQPKTEEKKEPKENLDRSFKIARKSKLSRVSKKALETNARTATIERVFERTPFVPQESNKDVYVQPLEAQTEEFYQAVKELDAEGRKIVSLGELKKQTEKAEQNIIEEVDENNPEEYSSIKYLSSGRAGEITGEYSGVHLGRPKPSGSEPNKQNFAKDNNFESNEDVEQEIQKIINRSKRTPKGFGSNFGYLEEPEIPEQKDNDDIDFSDAVVAEAILNPKYKQISKKNKK